MSRILIASLAVLCFLRLASAQTSGLELVSPSPVVMAIDKAGNGTISLLLKNTASSATTLNPALVSVTDFVHTAPDKSTYPLGAQATISGLPTASVLQGGLFTLKIAVSQVWEVGDSTAQLRNGEAVVCDIVARKEPVPFAVQIEGQNQEVVFDGAGDTVPSVILVNADRATYTFTWSVIAPGRAASRPAGPATIQPNSKLTLDLSAANIKPTFFSDGTLRDEILDGILQLTPVIGPGMSPQPVKQLALKLRLVFWSKYVEQGLNVILTGALVLIGMLASLWFRSFIPNATRGVKVRRQLRDMELKVKGIGVDLPSQARTVLEATITSCQNRLEDIPKVLPGFTPVLAEVQANATMCSTWVDFAYAVADVLGEAHRLLRSDLPPTLMNLIEDKCDHVLRPFLSGFTKPEELEAMKAALKDAQTHVDAAVHGTAVPDFENIIKAREDRIKPALQQLSTDYPKYTVLCNQVSAQIGTPVTPAEYRDRDVFSIKVELLMQYRDLALREGATVFPPAVAAGAAVGGGAVQPRDTALDRLALRYDDFLGFVNTESYQSLNMARILLAEMQQDFYPAALIAELEKDPPAIEIQAVPSPVDPDRPVHYSLRFIREALNQVAAVQEWTLRWKFREGKSPDEKTVTASQPPVPVTDEAQTESGWDIYHYFSAPGTHTVSVELIAFNGDPIPTKKRIEKLVIMKSGSPSDIRGKWWWPPSWTPEAQIEALRMAFVLAIALLGVFVTARQKVEQTGIFQGVAALVGIGFAADIVKNALTDK